MANINEITVITEPELLDYLGIDYGDDRMVQSNVRSAIVLADAYLKGAVGEDYPPDDPRAKELAKIVAADIYNNRGMTEKIAYTIRKLVRDFELQLRMELRRKAAAGTEDACNE